MNNNELIKKVPFGTSGARGLVADMTDRVCYIYTYAFIQYLQKSNQWSKDQMVVIGGDLRASSPRIMAACAKACVDVGAVVLYAGFVPSPAVALYGFTHGMPSLMVTGSHIPDDRNGIKFNTPFGEILKADEEGILLCAINVPTEGLFDEHGALCEPFALPEPTAAVRTEYVARYVDFFGSELKGMSVGVYQHSSVGRDVLMDIFAALGVQATALGRSERFIPVDTEAIRSEDVALARQWASEFKFNAIVSTDGDADRPLVSNERGEWLRGDILGVLCARFLGVKEVVTPVSSNTIVEKSSWFENAVRTRIGSPYVIDAMKTLTTQGGKSVAGYEANGGFLLATDVLYEGRLLKALPTRDAVVVMLSILALSKASDDKISSLSLRLPHRFTVSDRMKDFPTDISRAKLQALCPEDRMTQLSLLSQMFGDISGDVAEVNQIDGLRMTFANEEVIHLRPSGNAPELRCYTEASTVERAGEINKLCMSVLNTWRI